MPWLTGPFLLLKVMWDGYKKGINNGIQTFGAG